MELEQIRKEIDAVDDGIAKAFARRMELVKQVAEQKEKTNKAINDDSREREILFRLTRSVPEELALYLKEVYDTVFLTSKSYQGEIIGRTSPTAEKLEGILKGGLKNMPMSATVACQGVRGANSGVTAEKFFPVCEVSYFKTFEGVFGAVESGLCEFGVLPIENSTAGSVLEVYDLMIKHNFYVACSGRVKIRHCLAAAVGADLTTVKTVCSHPQAIMQCGEFLRSKKLEAKADDNTAVAAKRISESGDVAVAAICSPECAKAYGLKILQNDIQDSDANYTRFICITKDLQAYKGADRISVMTSLPHKPGSLYGILGRFTALGLNLTKLESRPIAGSDFEFMFYFDFEGDIGEQKVRNLIAELENESDNFVFLGAYKEKL